jgi:hypothetical protein
MSTMDELLGIGGSRIGWSDVPGRVRRAITAQLGAEVVSEASQPGGFSPGLAARLLLADGRRIFVKAVGVERNADAVAMTRREGQILGALPTDLPIAPLLGSYDDGDWVALLIADVEGRQPTLPWREEELAKVLDALRVLTEALSPSPIDVPAVEQVHPALFGQWQAMTGRSAEFDRLPRWAADNVEELAELEADAIAAAKGETLLHADLRADNMLLTEHGIVVVDWPHACRGAGWVDLLFMLPSVDIQGGPDPEAVWQRAIGGAAEPDRVNAVLATATGYFLVGALAPAPPNLPRLRSFQRAQGAAALAWLRSQLGR